MDAATYSHALLQAARRDFPSFYEQGTPRDKTLLDMLVLITFLVAQVNAHREATEPSRLDMQDTCDAAQQAFSELREKVRECPTFAALPMLERWKIESAIFRRSPSTD